MVNPVHREHLLIDRWSRSTAELAATVETEGFVPALLQAVQRLLHVDFVMVFGYLGRERPRAWGDTLDPERREIITGSAYIDGPYLLDPFFQLTLNGTRKGCFRLLDVAPDRFRQSGYYRTHYVRTGIGEEIGYFFDAGGGITGVTSFARWTSSPALGRGELELFRLIEPAIGAFCARHWSRLNRLKLAAGDTVTPTAIPPEAFGDGLLSARERQIITMILQGYSTESVANHLDISPGTVKIHRKNIYRKLQISTQAELFAAYLAFVQAKSRTTGLFPEGYTRPGRALR
jgi:DNA-binding CsgD family transcriptional regulator